MITAIQILIFVLFLTALGYYAMIAIFTYGWYKLKSGFEPETLPETKVTIVVALRNEENNILKLLENFKALIYPKELLEIVLVNDHSTDNTVKFVEDFIITNPELNIKLLNAENKGKKNAIKTGVEQASNNFILTTDGDCSPGKLWVRKMAAYYQKYNPAVILAPVVYRKKKSMLQRMFSLEFISLVASGAGAAGAGVPFMGNAANMGFEKNILKKNLKEKFASGDDVFLIHSAKKSYGSKSIHFLKDASVIMETEPPQTVGEFLKQRLRWGSKAKGYNDFVAASVSFLVFAFNFGLFLMFLLAFMYHWLFVVWFLFIALKTLMDLPLLQGFARLTGNTDLIIFIFPLEFVYPFYITFTAIASLVLNYTWKDRKNLK